MAETFLIRGFKKCIRTRWVRRPAPNDLRAAVGCEQAPTRIESTGYKRPVVVPTDPVQGCRAVGTCFIRFSRIRSDFRRAVPGA